MSSTTTQNCNVVSFSYTFVLKWTLKGKKFSDLRSSKDAEDVIRSDLYQFKTAKDLHFYLEISKPSYDNNARIKGSEMWSFKLVYAFLIVKDRAYQLKKSDQLSFLSLYYASSDADEEDVAVHFLVNACPVHPAPTAKEDEVILQKDQKMVDIESMPNFTIPSDCTNQIVIDFILRGDIPNFEHYMAIEIIEESKKHMCEVLKILCTEYLMNNITADRLRRILQAAVKNDLRLLERKCVEKITSGYIQINYS
ncbi:hypothetical protein AVEN_98356-1 [Araneus ventricosus]|uniref:BTB domain-containing protein n=1 Tax=Araneus ventricosus TaxID=182803 RepID=A0A4Y2NBN8_ARAVE|nr:hypothetical protein AVEN_98356-1 [Araneus ventricosus]